MGQRFYPSTISREALLGCSGGMCVWMCTYVAGGKQKTHLLTKQQNHANTHRFMVADDNTVDRWIVRDSDSRLNPRERFAARTHSRIRKRTRTRTYTHAKPEHYSRTHERIHTTQTCPPCRFAVEEWIQSGKAVHTIRDHPNHERPLNGGLWGGTKGAIKGMTNMIKSFGNKQASVNVLFYARQPTS